MKAFDLLVSLLICSYSFASRDDDDDNGGGLVMNITGIYLEDVESNIPDCLVDSVRLRQSTRTEGEGFDGLKKAYINGYNCYFNLVSVSNKSSLVSVNSKVPTTEADENVRNTIRLVKGGGEYVYDFQICAAAPSITEISNRMPNIGGLIIVCGSGLTEVAKVVFPGNVVVTEDIISGLDGEYFMIDTPTGVSKEGSSIFVEGLNGSVYSPAHFNYKRSLLLNSDGVGAQRAWGDSESMAQTIELELTSIGRGNVSQGAYCHLPLERQLPVATAKSRCAEVWTAGNGTDPDWLMLGVPAETPAAECAIQFEIYVPEPWPGSGFLKICGQNGFNGGEWERDCYNYVPRLTDRRIVPFQTTGWQAVAAPLSEFYRSKAPSGAWTTFADVTVTHASVSYANFGFCFENSDITLDKITGVSSDKETESLSKAASVRIHIGNWRATPLTEPEYTDLPDKEEDAEQQ